MKIDPVVGSVGTKITQIITALHRRLTLNDNIACAIVDVADSGTANTEFTVDHRLGYVPTVYIANVSKSGYVYDSSRATWTATQMTLKCSAANAAIRLVIF